MTQLTDEQYATFRARLETMAYQLRVALGQARAQLQQPEDARGFSQHQADEGSEGFERSMNLQTAEQKRAILQRVERSLEKLDEGTYGICDISQQPIPLARLEAIPYATMTVQAQQQMEMGYYS